MQLYVIDVCSINVIIYRLPNNKSIVKGFTTNPSLMRMVGAKNYKIYSKKILSVCNKKPVSLEVFADNFDKMFQQAISINSWGKNVYVKIPVVNSRGFFSGNVIKELSEGYRNLVNKKNTV